MTSTVQYAMVVNLADCVGCNACVIACKQENGLPSGKCNTWVETWDAGEYPAVKRANLPKLCNHCGPDAPCVTVCPTGATQFTAEGLVQIDHEKCVGCKACMTACPFGARWINEDQSVVEKCTFCAGRVVNGLLPACVGICPSHARRFGIIDGSDEAFNAMISSEEVATLGDGFHYDCRVHYLGLSDTEVPAASSPTLRGNVRIEEVEEG